MSKEFKNNGALPAANADSTAANHAEKQPKARTVRLQLKKHIGGKKTGKLPVVASKSGGTRSRLKQAAELIRTKQYKDASPILAEVLASDPENPDGIQLTGLIHLLQHRDREAIEWIGRAIALKPTAAPFHHNISGAYSRLGDFEKVRYHEAEAIRLKPDYAEAYHGLASAKKFEPPAEIIDVIEHQLRDDTLSERDQAYFHFAAGKVLDDVGEYDRAFPHYSAGNRLMNRKFNMRAFDKLMRDAIYQYGAQYVKRRAGLGHSGAAPLFIVSMPRSGSTLLEQILGGHSAFAAAGEVPDMHRISQTIAKALKSKKGYPHCMPSASPEMLRGFGEAYVVRVRTAAGVTDTDLRTIDKNPLNFRYVGLISEILPDAKIVNIRRDPRDTCLSCYFQNFTSNHGYTYNLRHVAHFYNKYNRICEHWASVLPDSFMQLNYEDLVTDTEQVARRVLAFCDLDFEESCLEFHTKKNRVATASAWQVRKPIYKGSVQRWRRYEKHLAPLLTTLELD